MRNFLICFTNFGPYHLARLRALAVALAARGDRLIAYETAATEDLYPWQRRREDEPFDWVTLFPDRSLESISRSACARAVRKALERDRPDGLGIVGYYRPESMAALEWACKRDRPTVLMSESQAIDHRRVWWKEAIKGRRVRRFSSALVGGPPHRDYLVALGMPRERIVLGYNAVDNAHYARLAAEFRGQPEERRGLPNSPFFLAVSRFAPEKNLVRLVRAYSRYRLTVSPGSAWDLVLCGDGPAASQVEETVQASGFASSIHRPGFLQADELARYYAFASAFVHPSLMEPWGLVVNEAAACGLPLLVSDRAGCVETFVPESGQSSGRRFDPRNVDGLAADLQWMAARSFAEREAMGQRARAIAGEWGPERFAQGTLAALDRAIEGRASRGRLVAATH